MIWRFEKSVGYEKAEGAKLTDNGWEDICSVFGSNILNAIREKISSNKELTNYTYKEILEEMYTLTKITYSGRYGSIISQTTKKQRIMLKTFPLEL